MDRLAEWTSVACVELGIDDPAEIDRAMVLDVTRNVTRATTKPAAAVTMFLIGVAVGRGMPGSEAAARITELANRWSGSAWDWRD